MSGLDGLATVGSYIIIDNNTSLTSMEGLGGLSDSGDGLGIGNNENLTSFEGLGSLDNSTGSLIVSNNDSLTSLIGLPEFTAGLINVSKNDSLTDLCDLYDVTPTGNFYVKFNDSLNSLTASDLAYYWDNTTSFSYDDDYFPDGNNGTETKITCDGDYIDDDYDNCPAICNDEQLDYDTDGEGDVCDDTPGCGGCGGTCELPCEM
jgi:hypothetical protein